MGRAPYAAKGRLVGFYEKVFSGPKQAYTRELYASHPAGNSTDVLAVMRWLVTSYQGRPANRGPRFTANRKSDWKKPDPVIRELRAAGSPFADEQNATSVEQQDELSS